MSSEGNTSVQGGENESTKGEENTPIKDMIQKLANKFEEAWDVDKNPKLEDEYDVTKNPTYQEKWAVSRNSATGQKKNAVLKDIFNDVAAKISDVWDTHDQSAKSEEAETGNEGSAKIAKGDSQKTSDDSTTKNEAGEKQASRSVEALSEALASDSASHHTAGSDSGDNPYVQPPVSVSRSGQEV